MTTSNIENERGLLPCPFCGHAEPSFERMGTSGQSCIVVCGNCGCRHESGDEYLQSGSSWNDRASLPDSAGEAGPVAWRPIATAPKDGTRFLAFYAGNVGFFHWQDFKDGGDSPVGWRDSFINVYPEGQGPAHWMPLPPAPGAAPHPVGSALTDALDRMDALLDPSRYLLSVKDESATAKASRADMALIRAALAAHPAPAVKGYHPGVSGEAQELLDWFASDEGFNQGTKAPHKWVLRAEQELRRLAAHSHPPATARQVTREEDQVLRAAAADAATLVAKGRLVEPAVAVQAEPAEAGITIYPGSHPTNPGGWNIHMKGHGCVAQMPGFTANPEARAAQERYRDLIVSALAAHPVPAARHSTNEFGDCPHWCKACKTEADERAAATQEGEPSDAEIERACAAYALPCKWPDDFGPGPQQVRRDKMRAALAQAQERNHG